MGGQLSVGLGEALNKRGFNIHGRELVGDFRKLDFNTQVDRVAADLEESFWTEGSIVIANSFGAYLFLHAQSQLKPFIGKVILLSPIVGKFVDDEAMNGFIPPYSNRLFEIANSGCFPTPKNCEIHVGSDDWQSNPTNVTRLATLLGIKVNIVANAGHMLPINYVGDLLDKLAAYR